jgi:hypothetical protein
MARIQLAVIDHNCHIFRKPFLTKSGKNKYRKSYSKRSKKWKITKVLEDKSYKYWNNLACRILELRLRDSKTVLRKVTLPDNHPKKISTSISLKPIP